ncbi:uncharacterized protein B0I36DRAFT_272104 [Microdochium trichocladiopsis]|uniref:Rhodopsin domain-containing protein n=1 Tax=Microdochium trichocladiopsis TaxID=1682393 RepID=A0A9P8Y5U9_9PEZI|nr:uncharacterized protein B0I36DRAFT_272104 [Microdochium trichocladiopsis]KAH7028190.1 hypothetical protein B0I36DRAFT_272104 [Microdochium trichocladiopsis]
MTNAESFTLLSLALCTIGVRMWYRWSQVGFSGFQLDDYLMPVSGLLFSLVTALAYLVGASYGGLTNSYMTDEEREALDPNSTEAYNREMGSKIQVIGWSFYAMELWVLKLCVTVFYSRLTTRLSNLHTRVMIAYGIIGVSYIAVALSILLGCQPMSRNWQINPNPGNLCQPTNSHLSVLMVYIPNVVTDLYLLSIPLPLLWGVNISLRRKITLMFLFSGAVFIMAAATIRAVVIITAGSDGAISGSQWACREIFVSAVVTNLPVIQPVLRKLANNMGLSVLFSRSGGRSGKGAGHGGSGKSYPLGSNPHQGSHSKGYGLGSRATRFGTRNGTVVGGGDEGSAGGGANTTTVAAWGSDEHILLEEGAKQLGPGAGATVVGDKKIVVGKEVSVVTETVAPSTHGRNASVPGQSAPTRDMWGYPSNDVRDSSSDRSSR